MRPTKVVIRLLALGYSYDEIRRIMKDFYIVSEEKTELLIEVVKKELEFLDREHINLNMENEILVNNLQKQVELNKLKNEFFQLLY